MKQENKEYTLEALKAVLATFTGENFGHDLRHLSGNQKCAIGMVYNAIDRLENPDNEPIERNYDEDEGA